MPEDWWRTGFNEAEQHQRYSTIPRRRCESLCRGDDFTFAGTESQLRKIEAKMHEWYEVKVRGMLGSGKRDVHEIETLGRN